MICEVHDDILKRKILMNKKFEEEPKSVMILRKVLERWIYRWKSRGI